MVRNKREKKIPTQNFISRLTTNNSRAVSNYFTPSLCPVRNQETFQTHPVQI